MNALVLITGGAGFIGSHLADRLLAQGYSVRVLDSLVAQVHDSKERPSRLSPRAELQVGDVRDPRAVARAMEGVDYVFHLAALVGVGQSMYRVADYVDVNVRGTAILLEELTRRPVKKLVVASSMSIYGEGAYADSSGALASKAGRPRERLMRGQWDLVDETGAPLEPVKTPESKRPELESVYALTKFDQERLCLVMGRAYGIPTVALRFFNVFGPGQALSNPYTGVLAIFASRLLNDRAPLLFEDGRQLRDFVSVHDVVDACAAVLASPQAEFVTLNVGSGQARTVRDVALSMAAALGKQIPPEVTGKYRVGDIRHCFADISLAREVIGYQPQVDFASGVEELGRFLRAQASRGQMPRDGILEARRELDARGLTL